MKAGYMEDWKVLRHYSGCPQGGIISPILANIYLNELDKYVEKLKEEFDNHAKYRTTPEYRRICSKRSRLRKKIDTSDGAERERLIEEHKKLTALMLKTPAKLCNDKKLKYVRYADDFLIAVNGNRQDCEWVKAKLTEFIRDTLKMELSQEKTLITHSSECARFLSYDVRVRRDQQVKPWKKCKQRTLNNTVELLIPLQDKIEKFLFARGAVRQRADNGKLEPVARLPLLRHTDLEIVTIFDAELRGLCNYYFLASNYRSLNYFSYLMEYSCLKRWRKAKCKLSKIYNKYRVGKKRWGIPYETKSGSKVRCLTKFNEIEGKTCEDIQPVVIPMITKVGLHSDAQAESKEMLNLWRSTDVKLEIQPCKQRQKPERKKPWNR